MKIQISPATQRLLMRTLADGADLADAEPRTMIEMRELGDALNGHARDCQELLRLVARRAAPKKLLPGPSLMERRTSKRKAHAEETARIRILVMARANGRCEACELYAIELEMDHALGGIGRRRQAQGVSTCWALCSICHRRKTANLPSREHWQRAFAAHLARLDGEPPEPLPDYPAPLLEDES